MTQETEFFQNKNLAAAPEFTSVKAIATEPNLADESNSMRYNDKLNNLRQQIDQIDDQIIALLAARMAVVMRVGELKKQNSESFFIKSSREADMIKNLLKKSDDKLFHATIVSIWRKIITNANIHEQPLKIAIHNPKNISDIGYLVREYYNNEVPILSFDSANNVVLELENKHSQIAIFELPNAENESEKKEDTKENWWISLAYNKAGLRVFAKIPFIEFANRDRRFSELQLVAVAIKPAEKSAEDCTVLVVEVASEVSRHQLLNVLKEEQLEARILKAASTKQFDRISFFLIELNGFFEENSEILKRLAAHKTKPFVKVIGHFAKPIQL